MLKNPFAPRPSEPLNRTPTTLTEVLTAGTPRAMALWLANTFHDVRDDQLAKLTEQKAQALTDLLSPDTASELLESVEPHTAHTFLRHLPTAVAAGLLDSLEADDATRIIELMTEEETQAILRAMEYSHSALVRGLLAWPEDSAASRMRPEFLNVGPEANIQQAVDAARKDPDDLEEGVFVTTDTKGGKVLLGWLSPTNLVLGRREAPVTSLMLPAEKIQQWAIRPLSDQETVSNRVRARDSQVIPVMEGVYLLGVITADTVNDILHEEATEDAERQGGSTPLEVPYLQASPIKLWSKRIGWLLALFVAAMYTSTVMKAFESEMETVVALTFFVPLLIGTGGNVGTQITTTLIRAIGQDGVKLRDLGRVVWKEMRTGSLVALTMAIAGAIRAYMMNVGPDVAITVAVSIAGIVLWASLVSSALPLLLKRVGVDPAVVSGPMISTIVDGTGLIIFFSLAKIIIVGL